MRGYAVAVCLGGATCAAIACGGTDFSTADSGAETSIVGGREGGSEHRDAGVDARKRGDRDSGSDAAYTDAVSDARAHHEGSVTTDASANDAPLDVATDGSSDAFTFVGDGGFCGSHPGDGVFVDNSQPPSNGCGSLAQPCADIAAGLGAATSLGKTTVYVATSGSPYAAFQLVDGISIIGGWSSASTPWVQTCNSGSTTIQGVVSAGPSAAAAVFGQGLSQGFVLQELTVKGDGDAGAGASLYGIFLSYSTTTSALVTLQDVRVSVGPGGAGPTGPTPPQTDAAPPPCVGVTSMMPGTTGSTGPAGQAGSFGPGGYAAASTGAVGGGGPGGTGGIGGIGPSENCGPGNRSCAEKITTHECANGAEGSPYQCPGGQGGCGGAGGLGGGAGGGGGSSVGVFAWGDVAIGFLGGTITAANGGVGGPGGNGGQGGIGGAGAQAAVTHFTYDEGCESTSPPCSEDIGSGSGTGGAGHQGEQGGQGGTGGGGAGGSSYAIYVGGGATVTETSSLALAAGAAGQGGSPNGADGTSQGCNTCPILDGGH
jgi:hypothetical protein